MRVVAGVVVGLLAALTAIVIAGIVAMGTTLSLPPGTDPGNMGQVYAIMTAMPQSTRIALALTWFAGAFAGATVAKLISRKAWLAWALALLVTLYVGYDGILLHMQIWVTALWIAAPLLGGLIGNRLVRGAPAVVAMEAETPPASP